MAQAQKDAKAHKNGNCANKGEAERKLTIVKASENKCMDEGFDELKHPFY